MQNSDHLPDALREREAAQAPTNDAGLRDGLEVRTKRVEAKRPRSLLAESPKAPAVAVIDCPACPEDREDCRFIFGAKNLSSMHSPLIYNRQGEPVAGGSNVHTRVIHCTSCNKFWTARQSQLEEAQGKPAKWELNRT